MSTGQWNKSLIITLLVPTLSLSKNLSLECTRSRFSRMNKEKQEFYPSTTGPKRFSFAERAKQDKGVYTCVLCLGLSFCFCSASNSGQVLFGTWTQNLLQLRCFWPTSPVLIESNNLKADTNLSPRLQQVLSAKSVTGETEVILQTTFGFIWSPFRMSASLNVSCREWIQFKTCSGVFNKLTVCMSLHEAFRGQTGSCSLSVRFHSKTILTHYLLFCMFPRIYCINSSSQNVCCTQTSIHQRRRKKNIVFSIRTCQFRFVCVTAVVFL